MAGIAVVLGGVPYGKERASTALRIVPEDAVPLARRGQNPQEFPGVTDQRMPNCEELLKTAVGRGSHVKACGVWCKKRGVKQGDVVEGVQITGMKDLVAWVAESDKTVFL